MRSYIDHRTKGPTSKDPKKNSVEEPTRLPIRKHIDQVEHAYSSYDTGYKSFIVTSEAMFAHVAISDQRHEIWMIVQQAQANP
jgi:hypothetical protein